MEIIQKLLALFQKLLGEGALYIAAVNTLLIALIGIFVLIPGDQPEKALQKIVDFIGKLSLKKKE